MLSIRSRSPQHGAQFASPRARSQRTRTERVRTRGARRERVRARRRTRPGALTPALGAALLLPALVSPLPAQQEAAMRYTPGRVLTLVKGDRAAEVRDPYRAVVDTDGRLFLTDSRKGDVLWFDENLVWKGSLAPLHPARSLGRPVRTVVDSRGRVLVADAEGRRINVFTDRAFVAGWGGRGDEPGRFDSLDDIAVDADDMIWAADADRGVINVFTPDGLLERVSVGFQGASFDKPALVAVDAAGGMYVYDEGRKVVLAGRADGTLRWRYDLNQRLGGKKLRDLAVGPTGAVFLVVDDRSRVVVLEPSGAQRGEIFGPGGRPGRFERLTGLSISAERSVMTVVDQKDLVVQEIRLAWADEPAFLEPARRAYTATAVDTIVGRVLAVAPGADGGDAGERWLVEEAGGLMVLEPSGAAVGRVAFPSALPESPVAAGTADGFVVVGEDRRVRRVTRDGQVVSSLPAATAGGELKRPEALAWRAADGALAVYDRDDDEIQILTSDGTFRQRVGRQGTGPGEISEAVALSFNSAGHLLVVDLEGSRVQRFDEHGIYVSGSTPVTIDRRAGNVALAAGADVWGRSFLLDERTGTAVQLGPDRAQCQVGAPWLMNPVTGFAITPAGDMLVSGGRGSYRTVRFRCTGPPPSPRGLKLTLDTGPEGGARLAWIDGTPGAASFEVFRRQDGEPDRPVATSSASVVVLPRAAWGTRPGELSVRGVSERGVPGDMSASITDRLTPALRYLVSGEDVPTAESLLREELAVAQAEDREDVVSLRAAFLQSIIAQEEYQRARSELEVFEANLEPEQAARMRLEIARAAVSGAIRAGAGATAVNWLRPIGNLAPETLSAVERLALDLDAAGDTDLAAELLVRHGYDVRLDGVELTLALAAVQVDLDRPEQAISTLIEASAAAEGPALRRQLDRGIFQLASDVTDGLLDGSIVGRPDLTAEQQVDVVLRGLETYAAGASGSSAEEWELRLGALAAKSRIQRAIVLEGSDFDAARELYEAILADTPFLLQSDEVRVRGRLGALALAEGREADARRAFAAVLEIAPDWVPSEEYFSPSVREFVAAMQEEAREAAAPDMLDPEGRSP